MLEKINQFIAKPIPQQLLFFNEMLTPGLIRIVYWLCLVWIVGSGLGKMFSGGFSGFLSGIVYTAIALILARVAAEVVILFFKINENIETLASNSNVSASSAAKKVTKKARKKVTKKA